jgi:RHS repeat-associated protein
LGSVSTIRDSNGIQIGDTTRYTPFGRYRSGGRSPVTDRAYTGQRENMELGLYYYNARYYLPGLSRFLSADTIVPDPQNPQQFNRYSYTLNNPLVFVDSTGHCVENYQDDADLLNQCIEGWNAISNYLSDQVYGEGGNGEYPSEWLNSLLANADITAVEAIMEAYGIDYGYTPTGKASYKHGNVGANNIYAERCRYWQNCYEPIVTRAEISPDVVIFPGASVSAAGGLYAVGGEEILWNRKSGEVSAFSYMGQGGGVALEADVTIPYGGLVWNLEQNIDYEGAFTTLTIDLSAILGGQFSFFWESATFPFTGETWGFSLGPSGGGGFGITGSQTEFICQVGC